MKSPSPRRSIVGFSIIELLTVVTIMAVLAALSSLSLGGMVRSNNIAVSANLIAGELNRARSAAIARNTNTELRIITSTTTPCIQTVLVQNDGTTVALTRPQYLPAGIAISPNTTYSGLWSLTQQTVPASLPNSGASYYAIRFGSTGIPRDTSGNALTTTNNYFTLLSSQDSTRTQLPSNWITVTIDDRTGTIRRYQP